MFDTGTIFGNDFQHYAMISAGASSRSLASAILDIINDDKIEKSFEDDGSLKGRFDTYSGIPLSEWVAEMSGGQWIITIQQKNWNEPFKFFVNNNAVVAIDGKVSCGC